MHIPTVTVKSEGELEEGRWYLITGQLQDGLNTLPQVFFLRKKILFTQGLGIPYMLGDLYYWSAGRKFAIIKHDMPLADVNIPPHGFHDVHMERINEATIQQRLRQEYGFLKESTQERKGRVDGWTPVSDLIYEPYL